MAKQTKRDSQTALQKKLEALKAQGRTNQELAASAGVSTRTLQQILQGEFKEKPTPNKPMMLRGYAESLTRLSVFCGLDPKDTLPEYGVSLSLPGVSGAMERVRIRSVSQGVVSDPSLDRILGRAGDINAGVLLWEPFAEVESGSAISNSWAWRRYLRPLLGTVNPLWRHDVRGIETIKGALDALLARTRTECEVVFGLYDNVYRRTRGLDFVLLPGLGVPLGVVSVSIRSSVAASGDQAQAPTDWAQLLEITQREFKAFVLHEEAGHLFLAGTCRFQKGTPKRELVTIEEGHTSNLAFSFLRDVVDGRKTDPGRQRIFVADLPTCRLRVFNETRPEKIDGLLTANGIHDEKLRHEYREAANALRLVPSPEEDRLDDGAPVYPIGIAVRADSQRWQKLLETATQELFRNLTMQMAGAYAELLESPSSLKVLRPLPLEPIIPRYYAEQFVKHLMHSVGDEARFAEWRKTWLSITS